jgi:hypothetical protein
LRKRALEPFGCVDGYEAPTCEPCHYQIALHVIAGWTCFDCNGNHALRNFLDAFPEFLGRLLSLGRSALTIVAASGNNGARLGAFKQ